MAFFNIKDTRYIPQPIPPVPPYDPPTPPVPPAPGGGSDPDVERPTFTGGTTIHFYKCTDEFEKLNKSFTDGISFTGVFKENVSVLYPDIQIQTTNDLSRYNYMMFNGRYYKISNCILMTGGIFNLTATVDVLSTYKDAIKGCKCIFDRLTLEGLSNRYLQDEMLVNEVRKQTDVIKWDTSNNEEGDRFEDVPTYILHTAGKLVEV